MKNILERKTWNEKIKIFRNLNGLTQRQLADLCCTTQKVIFSWERGICYPRKINRMAIAKALEVKVIEIFNPKEDKLNEKR